MNKMKGLKITIVLFLIVAMVFMEPAQSFNWVYAEEEATEEIVETTDAEAEIVDDNRAEEIRDIEGTTFVEMQVVDTALEERQTITESLAFETEPVAELVLFKSKRYMVLSDALWKAGQAGFFRNSGMEAAGGKRAHCQWERIYMVENTSADKGNNASWQRTGQFCCSVSK